MQVQAIVNLVATAVEGLSANQITVTDETGRMHHGPDAATSLDAINDRQMRAKFELEHAMERDLEDMLTNLVGVGLAFAEVTVDLDHDMSTVTTEDHLPVTSEDGQQLFRDRTVRSEYFRDQPAEEGGELYIELPDDIDTDGDGLVDETVRYYLDDRDERYLYNTVVATTDNAPGEITRLSVAVGVDDEQVDAALLGDLENLVGAAVGFDQERGDTLAVTAIPINADIKAALTAEAEAQAEAEALTATGGMDLVALIRTVGTVLVALLVVILALRSLARGPKREVVESIDLDELERGEAAAELEAGDDEEENEDEAVPALTGGDVPEDEEGVDPPEVRLESLIANQTDEVAGMLRSWLSDAEGEHEAEVVAR
jgi:flagellar M-ring protein FliF